jgi:hypothetical protein
VWLPQKKRPISRSVDELAAAVAVAVALAASWTVAGKISSSELLREYSMQDALLRTEATR